MWMIMRFAFMMENGAVGTMTASWTYYGEEDNSTIIYGSEGILKIYDDPNYSIVRIGKDGTKIYYELIKCKQMIIRQNQESLTVG